jgi:hypothetical protein
MRVTFVALSRFYISIDNHYQLVNNVQLLDTLSSFWTIYIFIYFIFFFDLIFTFWYGFIVVYSYKEPSLQNDH